MKSWDDAPVRRPLCLIHVETVVCGDDAARGSAGALRGDCLQKLKHRLKRLFMRKPKRNRDVNDHRAIEGRKESTDTNGGCADEDIDVTHQFDDVHG